MGDDIAPTLISRYSTQVGNTQDRLNVIQKPTLIIENHPNDSRVRISDVFQTLSGRAGTGGAIHLWSWRTI